MGRQTHDSSDCRVCHRKFAPVAPVASLFLSCSIFGTYSGFHYWKGCTRKTPATKAGSWKSLQVPATNELLTRWDLGQTSSPQGFVLTKPNREAQLDTGFPSVLWANFRPRAVNESSGSERKMMGSWYVQHRLSKATISTKWKMELCVGIMTIALALESCMRLLFFCSEEVKLEQYFKETVQAWG